MKVTLAKILAAFTALLMLLCILPSGVITAEGDIPIDEAHFPDASFRNFVLTGSDDETGVKIDTNSNGLLSPAEIAAVTSIDVSKDYDTPDAEKIADLTGIEYFTALKWLNCSDNQLTALDVSNNTALNWLYCYRNQLTHLDVSNNTALTELCCSFNQLTQLDVSNNTALTYLGCGSNQLTQLDVSNNTALKQLDCDRNQLTALDVSNNTVLTSLSCSGNQLTELDVSNNTALTGLGCNGNQLTELDVSHNTALMYLICAHNQLTSLDVSNNTALTELYCSDNQLTSLDVSKNTTLRWLPCSGNQLTSLDVSNNTALELLFCDGNQLTTLNVNGATALRGLDCQSNKLTQLDVSKNTALTNLSCHDNQLTSLDVSKNTALTYLNCGDDFWGGGNQLTHLDVSNNIVLRTLRCEGNQLTALDVNGATALEILSCRDNQLISLDVSNNTALTKLYCFGNQLTSLDVSNNTALEWLDCSGNQLTELDVSNNTALGWLECGQNQLTELDVSNNTALEFLFCKNNQLTQLDVSNNTALTELVCYYNQLTSLDVSANAALDTLDCSGNQLTSLDLSQNNVLTEFSCGNNQYKTESNPFDLSNLPAGFNLAKTSNWYGGALNGNMLSFTSEKAMYTYDCGNNHFAVFSLLAPEGSYMPVDYYTVTFNLMGGEGDIPAQQVPPGGYVTEPEDPVRGGYVFKGWYAADNVSISPHLSHGELPWFNLYNHYQGEPVFHDVTLYANWEESRNLNYGTDTFNFENTGSDFFRGSTGTYTITGDYHNVLFDDLEGTETDSNTEKGRVLERMNREWGGSCFGMSCVLSLVRAHHLDVDFFQKKADCLHDFKKPKKSKTIFNLINYYHLMQYTDRTRSARGYYTDESVNNRNLIEAIQSSSYPVVIVFNIYENNSENSSETKQCIGGHAVVAFRCVETDSNYEVYIWDPNDQVNFNILYVSKDYASSNFRDNYDSGIRSSFIACAFKVEDEDYDYKNIEERLKQLGHSHGWDANAAPSYDAEAVTPGTTTRLNTSYDDFTIYDLTSGASATVVDAVKTEGELDISDGIYFNEIGYEPDIHFVINGVGEYKIIPAVGEDDDEGIYDTAMGNDLFYTHVVACAAGEITFDIDGKVTTDYTAPVIQKITSARNDSTTTWYMVTVESENDGMTVDHEPEHTEFSTKSPADITVTARDSYNSIVFEDYSVNDTPVTLSETAEHTAVLGSQEQNMGYALIIYSLGGTPIEAQCNIPAGQAAVRPEDPERAGFIFGGWYTSPDCADGSEWSFDTPLYEDTRIFAKWLIDENYTHTVTFRAEGFDDQIIIVYDGDSLAPEEIPLPPEKLGYDAAWDVMNFQDIHSDILTNAVYIPLSGLPGDYDCSGVVNVQDAILTLRAAMNLITPSEQALINADIDNNGMLTVTDAITILRMAMGLI